MAVQEQQKVDNNAIYAFIQQLRTDFESKFDRLSDQVSNVRVLVLQAQSSSDAHNLPSRVEDQGKRIAALELARAAENLSAVIAEKDKQIAALVTRLDAANQRIEALEDAAKAAQSVKTGQKSVWDRVQTVASFLGLLVGLIVGAMQIWGK